MLHDTSTGEECKSCYLEDCITEYVILFPRTRTQLCLTTMLEPSPELDTGFLSFWSAWPVAFVLLTVHLFKIHQMDIYD